jgi:protein-S-isoprenylcysteine O-methyltransferase Ste14
MSRAAGAAEGASPVRGALPALGPRGEGWIAIQTALAITLLALAPLDPWAWAGPARVIAYAAGTAASLVGVALFAWGAITLGPSFSIWVAPASQAHLVVGGPYRWTRHPICTAQAIFGFGWALMFASPVALGLGVVYAAYLDRGKLRREEETLLARYPDYAAYMRRVRHRMWPAPPGPMAPPARPHDGSREPG